MDIARNVKAVAHRHGMRMKDIASKVHNTRTNMLGMSMPAFYNMLHGTLPLSRIEELATIIGADIAEFFVVPKQEGSTTPVAQGTESRMPYFEDCLRNSGMTMSEFAERFRGSRGTAYKVADTDVKLSTLFLTAEALNVPVWRLLCNPTDIRRDLGSFDEVECCKADGSTIRERIKAMAKKHGMKMQDVYAKMRNTRGGSVGIRDTSFASVVSRNISVKRLHEIANIIGCNAKDLI